VTIRVKVIPRSSKSEIAGQMQDGTLKIRVAAPPDKGQANEEVCALLAGKYGVARNAVRIVSGQTSGRKLIRIDLADNV
jgi:uncharacterized protein (TIGR00251 family)